MVSCTGDVSAYLSVSLRCILPGYLTTEPGMWYKTISTLQVWPVGKIPCLSIDMGFCLRAKGYLILIPHGSVTSVVQYPGTIVHREKVTRAEREPERE